MEQFFTQNLDFIYFVYGLSYLLMGVAILLEPRKSSHLGLTGTLWLLALFGILHGANEFIDMWVMIKGQNMIVNAARFMTLVLSYVFLFEFGKELLRISDAGPSSWQQILIVRVRWVLAPVTACLVFVFAFAHRDVWTVAGICTRYLFGFPAGAIVCVGMLSYYARKREALDSLKVGSSCLIVAASFLLYAFFGGLVVPKSSFFPANWLNADSFFSVMHVPVQLFRALVAVLAFLSIIRMIRIFNFELERGLADVNRKLVESGNRKSEYVSFVSHELKTPLTTMMGFAQTILALKPAEEQRSVYLKYIESEGKRLVRLIDDFLDLARFEAGVFNMRFDSVDISNLIKESLTSIEMPAAGINVEADVPEGFPSFRADGDKIKQVLINLLSNQLRYTPKDEKISIKVRELDGSVIVSIRDRGPGIKKEDLEKIFDKFYRGDDAVSRASKGNGLGLAISAEIVKAHNGRIWAESEEGKGSTFFFALPKVGPTK